MAGGPGEVMSKAADGEAFDKRRDKGAGCPCSFKGCNVKPYLSENNLSFR